MVIRHPYLKTTRPILGAMVAAFFTALTFASPTTAMVPPPATTPAKTEFIYLIELHGTVGSVPGAVNTRAITAQRIQDALTKARKAGATVVVLDIDGPGGLVSEMQEMVEVILEAQKQDGMRIVAMPREAYSAWSIVALTCKEILVTPMTRMGAAVTITQNGRGGFIEVPEDPGAVAQKMKAPWNSLRKMAETYTSRPPCIMDAMQEQKAELWWSPTHGFAPTRGTGSDWEQLDDGVKVCCLNRDEMLRTKLAVGEVKPNDLPQGLPTALGLPAGSQVFVSQVTTMAGTTPRTGNAASDKALRDASRRCREALDLIGRVDLRRHKKTYTTWQSGDVNRPKEPQTTKRWETDAEFGGRIASEIRKAAAKVPQAKSVQVDPWYVEQLSEIDALLDEATRSAKSCSIGAVEDRLKRAASHLQAVADRF